MTEHGAAAMHAPFRADHVGSLLRPDWLAQARAQCQRGDIDAAALAATEDRAIREAVRQQEAIGLHSITDGEFRRDWWHLDFLAQLDGVRPSTSGTIAMIRPRCSGSMLLITVLRYFP